MVVVIGSATSITSTLGVVHTGRSGGINESTVSVIAGECVRPPPPPPESVT